MLVTTGLVRKYKTNYKLLVNSFGVSFCSKPWLLLYFYYNHYQYNYYCCIYRVNRLYLVAIKKEARKAM